MPGSQEERRATVNRPTAGSNPAPAACCAEARAEVERLRARVRELETPARCTCDERSPWRPWYMGHHFDCPGVGPIGTNAGPDASAGTTEQKSANSGADLDDYD